MSNQMSQGSVSRIFYGLSFGGYLLIVLAGLGFGFRYSFLDKMMPYQLEALNTPWESIDPVMQVLILNFIKSYAAGWLVTGISVLFLLMFPFRKKELWSYWALFVISFTEMGIIAFRTYQVKLHTSGNPPLTGVLMIVGIVILSFIFSMISKKSTDL